MGQCRKVSPPIFAQKTPPKPRFGENFRFRQDMLHLLYVYQSSKFANISTKSFKAGINEEVFQ